MHQNIAILITFLLSALLASLIINSIENSSKKEKIKKEKTYKLSKIVNRLKAGMSIDEVEYKCGHFDRIEMRIKAKQERRLAYFGIGERPRVILKFTGNELDSWKLLA